MSWKTTISTPLANLLRPPDRGGQSVVVAKMIQVELQVDFRSPPVECFLQASTTRPAPQPSCARRPGSWSSRRCKPPKSANCPQPLRAPTPVQGTSPMTYMCLSSSSICFLCCFSFSLSCRSLRIHSVSPHIPPHDTTKLTCSALPAGCTSPRRSARGG